MNIDKRVKKVTICLAILVTIGMFFSFSCNRSLNSKAITKAAVLSIGKLDGKYSNCDLQIDVSVDGVGDVFSGNRNLVKKVYKAGQTALVGAKSVGNIQNCNNKTLYTEKKTNSKCPYVSRQLSLGVNHVTIKFCAKDAEGNEEEEKPTTTPGTDKEKPDADKEKPDNKETDDTKVEIITTIQDDDLDLPKEISIQITPTVN